MDHDRGVGGAAADQATATTDVNGIDAVHHAWHPVAWSREVAHAPLPVRLLDEPLVLWRPGPSEPVSAFYDPCIHRGTPLSLGWVDGDRLVCGYHGWAYDAASACVRIPALPASRGIPAKARATPLCAEERHGLVWVALDEPRLPIPTFPPEVDDSAWRVVTGEGFWRANAARFVENNMDVAHFAWVHEDILGTRDRAEFPDVPEVPITPIPDGFHFELDVDLPGMGAHRPRGTLAHRTYDVRLPFTLQIDMWRPEGAKSMSLVFVCSPVSLKETRFFFVNMVPTTGAYGQRSDQEIADLVFTIAAQDRRIVEAQRPEELPLDLREELHLRGPDTAALA